jgi:hypothetical protein
MTENLRYDFPVASFVEHGAPEPRESWEDPIFDAEGKDWENGERGDDFGTVTVVHEDKAPPKWFEATFRFRDRDAATYEGKVPGDGSWKGKEKLKLKRQGKKKRKDPIELDSRNPKRWG